MALNQTQRNILDATLRFPLDEIKAFTFGEATNFNGGIENSNALKALQLILAENITPSQQAKLQEWGVDAEVDQIRRLLSHPAPQNRAENYPYFAQPTDPTQVVFRGPDERPHFEMKGLLGLTARNNDKISPVTREDVTSYIN